MVEQESYTNFFIAVSSAEGYHRTAKMVKHQIRDGLEFLIKFSSVYVVNLAFACELYLKALLLLKNINFPKGNEGHNLKKLYNCLDNSCKSEITQKFNCTTSIDIFFENHLKVFVNYRYPYEIKNDRKPVHLNELETFTNVLESVCEKYQEEKTNAD